MADTNQEVSENNEINEEKSQIPKESEEVIPEKCDWMLKRTKISHKWENTYFHLKNTSLFYGDHSEGDAKSKKSLKEIPLQGAEIGECEIDRKENVFSIKPKDCKRVYYIQAKTKEVQHAWMEALCFAKVNGRNDGNSEACIVQ